VCFWFPKLVSQQRNSERKFGSRSALFIYIYAFILFVVDRNAIFDIFIFIASASVHVCLVACLRLNEIREHHSWCFMINFVH
jgi:hypothetical protein